MCSVLLGLSYSAISRKPGLPPDLNACFLSFSKKVTNFRMCTASHWVVLSETCSASLHRSMRWSRRRPWKGASSRPSGRLEHYVSGDDGSRPLASLPCPPDAVSGFLSLWGPFFVMPCLFSCVDFGKSFRKFAMVLFYMLILNSFIEGSRRNSVSLTFIEKC